MVTKWKINTVQVQKIVPDRVLRLFYIDQEDPAVAAKMLKDAKMFIYVF